MHGEMALKPMLSHPAYFDVALSGKSASPREVVKQTGG
mgnify:CR=1 FL=1